MANLLRYDTTGFTGDVTITDQQGTDAEHFVVTVTGNGDGTFHNLTAVYMDIDGNWCEDVFLTKEEAIKRGIEYAKEEEITEFYVAEITEIPVIASFDMDDILNRVSENMDENYGWEDGEPGESFYENLSNEDIDVLEKMLEKVKTEVLLK